MAQSTNNIQLQSYFLFSWVLWIKSILNHTETKTPTLIYYQEHIKAQLNFYYVVQNKQHYNAHVQPNFKYVFIRRSTKSTLASFPSWIKKRRTKKRQPLATFIPRPGVRLYSIHQIFCWFTSLYSTWDVKWSILASHLL